MTQNPSEKTLIPTFFFLKLQQLKRKGTTILAWLREYDISTTASELGEVQNQSPPIPHLFFLSYKDLPTPSLYPHKDSFQIKAFSVSHSARDTSCIFSNTCSLNNWYHKVRHKSYFSTPRWHSNKGRWSSSSSLRSSPQ